MPYGYALNFDIRNVSLVVKDQDRTAKSRELVSAFVNSGYFNFVGYVDSDREIDRLIDEGRVRTVLTIPSGLARRLALRQPVVAGDHRRGQRQHRLGRDGIRARADR